MILDLLGRSMGLVVDARYRGFFAWKHTESPFGPSPAWVAEDTDGIVGFRTFLRWEFERDGAVVHAVRAVDTATDERARGRGVFTSLTTAAVDAMIAAGTAFVFNTPNDQSRPGYLKMGWEDVGRAAVKVRPRSLRAAAQLRSARTPADIWSTPTEAGAPALDLLADDERVSALLAGTRPALARALHTRRGVDVLRWRYGFPPLAYRAAPVGDRLEDGLVLFRIRQRGPLREAAITEVVAPPGQAGAVRRAIGAIVRAAGADYAIALGSARSPREGWLPLPRQGPALTWRRLNELDRPPLASWSLSLGDIELF